MDDIKDRIDNYFIGFEFQIAQLISLAYIDGCFDCQKIDSEEMEKLIDYVTEK